MQLSRALTGLPASLLLLVATQIEAQQLPTAIKKMSLDEGEKILPHYLAFAPEYAPAQSSLEARRDLTAEEELRLASNSSATLAFRAPFGIHYGPRGQGWGSDDTLWRRAREALGRLQGRQFACPQNTASCESIGQPNYCCATGETCFTVQNAPDAGNVGCCPNGQDCAGSVGACGSGSTACPADVGGGCCIPGFACAAVGCVASSVSVITLTTTSSTMVVTVTTTAPSTSTTTTQTTTAATPTQTSTTTTETGASPPFRPTSGTTSPTTTATTDGVCPTGFYACLATAGAGCCRTGRDCITTSCPPVSSTTITSNDVTLVVPATDLTNTATLPTSTCAGGWFLCPSDAGPIAGCCPSGYACGTASCTLSATTATATVQKVLPSAGHGTKERVTEWGVVIGIAGFMVGSIM